MRIIFALGMFTLLIAAAIAGVLWLDRVMVARVEREDRAHCDACLSGGGVTMLPSGARHTLCDEHQARLMRIMELESKMDENYGT